MRFSINAIGYLFVAIFVVVGAVLLFVPMVHTGDGWGYATDVLRAETWNSPHLVSAHHLFYNYLCYALSPILVSCKINPINGFTAINWIFYGFAIFVFYQLLLALRYNKNQSLYWTILIAGCFGLLRFALENETYILPLFFALLGSHFIIHLNNRRSNEFIGFSFLAISVLFHQSYIFWLLAFVVNAIDRRRPFAPLIAILIIMSFYVLFAIKEKQPILTFVLHDVNSGIVQVFPNLNNLKFTLINGIRTIFQVHGNMLILFENWIVISIIGISGATLFFVGVFKSLKNQTYRSTLDIKKFRSSSTLIKRFRNPFFVAFVLQLAFAFYSVGNAEFMVMLPMLFILSFHDKIIPVFKHIRKMVLGIWIYNAVFFLVPTCMGSFDDIGLTSKMLIQEHSSKPFVFISTQAIAIQNQIEYDGAMQKINATSMGQTSNPKVSKFKLDGQFLIGQNSDEMHLINRALINLNTDVYTDNSIIFNKISGGSRAAFLINPKLKNELSNRTWQTVREDSFTSPRRKLELFKMVRGVCISH